MTSAAFAPAQLGPITLRNRVIKAATFEGRTPKRVVTPELIEFHRRFAAGGVGMTTVAYCAVTRAGTTDGHQIVLDDPAVGAGLHVVARFRFETRVSRKTAVPSEGRDPRVDDVARLRGRLRGEDDVVGLRVDRDHIRTDGIIAAETKVRLGSARLRAEAVVPVYESVSV